MLLPMLRKSETRYGATVPAIDLRGTREHPPALTAGGPRRLKTNEDRPVEGTARLATTAGREEPSAVSEASCGRGANCAVGGGGAAK
jgi:hypothetical protein